MRGIGLRVGGIPDLDIDQARETRADWWFQYLFSSLCPLSILAPCVAGLCSVRVMNGGFCFEVGWHCDWVSLSGHGTGRSAEDCFQLSYLLHFLLSSCGEIPGTFRPLPLSLFSFFFVVFSFSRNH